MKNEKVLENIVKRRVENHDRNRKLVLLLSLIFLVIIIFIIMRI